MALQDRGKNERVREQHVGRRLAWAVSSGHVQLGGPSAQSGRSLDSLHRITAEMSSHHA